MRTPEQVLLRPLLTEKVLELSEERGKYGFEVFAASNKHEVKYAVEKKFGVKVNSVNIIVVKGKRKRMSTRKGMTFGKRRDYKKAIVTLAEGNTIDFFAGTAS